MIQRRCGNDGADLVCLRAPAGSRYLYCPVCATAILDLVEAKVRIRWRYRAGDLFLLDPPDPRADVHVPALRDAVAQFQRIGCPFDPECFYICRSTTVVAEAERVKLVWCDCKTGTAYGARPKYGWVQMGVFKQDGTRYVLQDYFGPSDMESVIESAVARLPPPT